MLLVNMAQRRIDLITMLSCLALNWTIWSLMECLTRTILTIGQKVCKKYGTKEKTCKTFMKKLRKSLYKSTKMCYNIYKDARKV